MAGSMAGALPRSLSIVTAALCNVIESSAGRLTRTDVLREVRPPEEEAPGFGARFVGNGGEGPPRGGSWRGGSSWSKRGTATLASWLECLHFPVFISRGLALGALSSLGA